jgi:hypothetical protein
LHINFLSIPPARYAGKAGEVLKPAMRSKFENQLK